MGNPVRSSNVQATKQSHDPVVARRHLAILGVLADESCTARELAERLGVSAGTIFKDLDALAKRFPDQVQRIRGGDARTVRWQVSGLPPTPLTHPLDHLTADEIAALIAARGLLRSPDTRSPGWEKPSTPYSGDLSRALHGLLDRAGLAEETKSIAPRTLGVSRFGIAPEAPGALANLERALRTGQCTCFRYRNRTGIERDVHLWPIRLVLIKGEWYLYAWAPGSGSETSGKVKQYALSRIISRDPTVRVVAHRPSGTPTNAPHNEVDAALATGFHATGSADSKAGVRVTLAISPEAWPHWADRNWGEGQRVNEPLPTDLPHGWHRLSFRTTGLLEARHFILGMGVAVRVESPPELRAWIREQALGLVSETNGAG